MSNQPTIALVYDHIATQYGGAEHILKALHQAFPEAPLYTSVYNQKKVSWAKDFKIKTTFLQKIPFLSNFHRVATLAMPLAFETLNLDAYEVIISVSSTCAKGVITKPHQLHISYLLTPTRFLFSHNQVYKNSKPWLKLPIISFFVEQVTKYLHTWDVIAAQRADQLVTISDLIAKRAEEYYSRKADKVIYPPIPTQPNTDQLVKQDDRSYYLCLSRLVPYKRIDLAIQACYELNKALIIAGDGPEKKKLSTIHPDTYLRQPEQTVFSFLTQCFKQCKTPVCFVGEIDEEEKQTLLANSKALLFPGEEDFGITPLEGAQYGTPTILHPNSGVAEIISQDLCVYSSEESEISLVAAIQEFEKRSISQAALQKLAKEYDTSSFVSTWQGYVQTAYKKFRQRS